MSCKIINKDFNLFSCNKKDVENEWMDVRTYTYHADYDIETLMIFYNPQTDKLTLVEEAECFEELKVIAEEYLTLDCNQRNELHINHIPKSIVGFMNVLKATVDMREKRRRREETQERIKSLRKILEQQYGLPCSEVNIIFGLYDEHGPGSKSLGLIDIYNYGVIQGKRAERAKKQKHQSEVTA